MNLQSSASAVNYGEGYAGATISADRLVLTSAPQPNRTITISPQNIGYLVTVGCQNFAIETKERLIEKLIAYINDPVGTEQKYNQGKLFN